MILKDFYDYDMACYWYSNGDYPLDNPILALYKSLKTREKRDNAKISHLAQGDKSTIFIAKLRYCVFDLLLHNVSSLKFVNL